MDKITIITPCFNSEKYIKQTIISVLNQSIINWEWIIVDNNSTDNSINIIKEFKDHRINLIELDNNYGVGYARNIGITKATGRYITFIDSDDIWLPSFLEITLKFLNDNNEEIVYTSYKRYNEELKPILPDFIAEDNINFSRLLYNCPMPMLTTIYDSKRIGKILIPNIKKREDYAMWLEIMQKIPFARAIKEPLAIYRIRNNSYSRNKFSMAYYQFLVYLKFLKLPIYKSIYYTFFWAFNGLKKYGRI